MLFGRKKPGFVKIEEIAKAAGEESDKPDLLEYLTSLPEAEDEFAEFAESNDQEPEEEGEEMTEAGRLADYIRIRSGAGSLTGYSSLKEEIEEADRLLEEIREDENCKDIACKEGKKDRYYYSQQNMSDNYAMIAALVEDKDLAATMVHMVRFNSKTYPAPTPLSYFERHPYYATKPQIERAYQVLSGREENGDIQRFTNNRNSDFLFSTQSLSPKYAKALAHEDDFAD
ncbi:MAG: hypothetical protein QM657_08665 [Lacrimispora sp.]|uniref:hypothetical protein n=1 Tax=Lacrimispora sp. TaxID=2719234 RepID=UPI0039E41B9F